MVGKTELILICLVAVALLALVARKIRIPYPILLTCGGVLLALVPGLPAIHLEPKLVFDRWDFSALIADPEIIGLHISPKGRGNQPPIPGSLYAWAAEQFGAPLS